jgi:Flp pilus assembly protein CpaB
MKKPMGILMIVIFGVSGIIATAVAWLLPALNLDKTIATIIGAIGITFVVIQSLELKHISRIDAENIPVKVHAKDNNKY